NQAMVDALLAAAPAVRERNAAAAEDLAAALTALGAKPEAIAALRLRVGDTSHANLRRLVADSQSDAISAQLGRRVFERSACVRCHSTTRDELLGPSLRGIGKAANIENLLESVLEPSKTIKTGYLSEVVETESGQVYSGIVSDAPGDQLRVTGSDQTWLIDKSDVAARAPLKKSIMPEGQEQQLSPQEFVDLVHYLQSLE
ncbi:MAG: c-type cytochrome, partial [Planctomycetales bacterium]|nr:c-type cytochrome [Planctomycetales bacterium]